MLNRKMNRQPVTRPAAAAVLVAFVALTASIAGFEAFAQARFAIVSGTVVDQAGGVFRNTTLVLSNVQTAAKNEVRTNQTGFYEFVGIPAGDYHIEISRPAFRTVKDEISIGIGENIQRNFSMRIASVEEAVTVTGSPSVPARPMTSQRSQGLPPRPPCADPAVGGCVRPPVKMKDVRPIYPPALSESGIEGVVTLEATIAADGKTKDLRVISSPHPGLDRAAIDAVSGWEFLPTTLNNNEIDTPMTISVSFTQPSGTPQQ